MGLAIEILGFHTANPGATFTAVTMATGDSATVRIYREGSRTVLEHLGRQGATAGSTRILSPLLHDNVKGITVVTAETPAVHLLPDFTGQPLGSGDTLTIQQTGGTAETEVGFLEIYYEDVKGLDARLYSWDEIRGAYEHVKPIEVDCTIGGTAGVWSDTLMNATDGQQKADYAYAILGWTTDTALAAVAIKGSETGNVRIGGPGPTSAEDTSAWFVKESQRMGTPHIPVISALNFGNTNVSVLTTATSGTAKVVLNAVQMRKGFSG